MIVLHTALGIEAKPFIESLKLKQQGTLMGARYYLDADNNWACVVSGVGRMRTAIGLTACLAELKQTHEIELLINMGISGAKSKQLPLGQCFRILKIIEQSTDREFYPELLFISQYPSASITTLDKPLIDPQVEEVEKIQTDLVDMEVAAFYQTAEKLVGPERITSYKCVSDYLENICNDTEMVTHQLNQLTPPLIEEWQQIRMELSTLSHHPLFPDQWNEWVKQTATTMALTETQINLLNNAAQRCWKRNTIQLPQIAEWVVPTRSKKERNDAFKELLDALNQ